jgi:hypothetical protein
MHGKVDYLSAAGYQPAPPGNKVMAKRKKQVFSASKEVRAIARERVGRVKAGVVIVPKAERKPKYKVDPLKEADRQ